MSTRRQAALGLLAIATAGIVKSAGAQEPWVAPENAPAETPSVPASPAIPIVPPPDTTYVRSGTMTMDTGATPTKFDHHVRPPARAFELQIGMGYGQGFGDIGSGLRDVHDLSGAGGTIQLTLGYRATPHFMLGIYGTGSQFARGGDTLSGTEVQSATAGLQADFHFRPSYVMDPWVSLSTGWRGMWLTPDVGENTSLVGLQLARLQIGLDFRLSPDVAIAPVVGGDASMFLSQNGPLERGFTNIGDPHVNFFVFGGLQARFDLGGASSSAYAGRTPTRGNL